MNKNKWEKVKMPSYEHKNLFGDGRKYKNVYYMSAAEKKERKKKGNKGNRTSGSGEIVWRNVITLWYV